MYARIYYVYTYSFHSCVLCAQIIKQLPFFRSSKRGKTKFKNNHPHIHQTKDFPSPRFHLFKLIQVFYCVSLLLF